MTTLMNFMMNNKCATTPEDHINSMAGLAYSMLSYSHLDLKIVWFIDTGASHHMSCNKSLFTHLIVVS